MAYNNVTGKLLCSVLVWTEFYLPLEKGQADVRITNPSGGGDCLCEVHSSHTVLHRACPQPALFEYPIRRIRPSFYYEVLYCLDWLMFLFGLT